MADVQFWPTGTTVAFQTFAGDWLRFLPGDPSCGSRCGNEGVEPDEHSAVNGLLLCRDHPLLLLPGLLRGLQLFLYYEQVEHGSITWRWWDDDVSKHRIHTTLTHSTSIIQQQQQQLSDDQEYGDRRRLNSERDGQDNRFDGHISRNLADGYGARRRRGGAGRREP